GQRVDGLKLFFFLLFFFFFRLCLCSSRLQTTAAAYPVPREKGNPRPAWRERERAATSPGYDHRIRICGDLEELGQLLQRYIRSRHTLEHHFKLLRYQLQPTSLIGLPLLQRPVEEGGVAADTRLGALEMHDSLPFSIFIEKKTMVAVHCRALSPSLSLPFVRWPAAYRNPGKADDDAPVNSHHPYIIRPNEYQSLSSGAGTTVQYNERRRNGLDARRISRPTRLSPRAGKASEEGRAAPPLPTIHFTRWTRKRRKRRSFSFQRKTGLQSQIHLLSVSLPLFSFFLACFPVSPPLFPLRHESRIGVLNTKHVRDSAIDFKVLKAACRPALQPARAASGTFPALLAERAERSSPPPPTPQPPGTQHSRDLEAGHGAKSKDCLHTWLPLLCLAGLWLFRPSSFFSLQ
ncbi:hypothetical protein L249_8262, partial [Ophiocordyceps polyrhachis-furcata BCC 54312]